jgi:hypothetical protein
MKVFLDDIRPMPVGFDFYVKTAGEAIELLKTGEVTVISLDHDLGLSPDVGSGYEVACFIEQSAYHGTMKRLDWHIHSANGVGIINMRVALMNADRYWTELEEDD